MAVTRITKEDLKAKLDGDEAGKPVLVDARLKYPWEHSTMKLPGAVRVVPTAVNAAGLPKDRAIVVYCSDPDEITSVRVAGELLGAGLKAGVLKGGLPEWVAANLPVDTKDAVRAAAPPPAAAAAKA